MQFKIHASNDGRNNFVYIPTPCILFQEPTYNEIQVKQLTMMFYRFLNYVDCIPLSLSLEELPQLDQLYISCST